MDVHSIFGDYIASKDKSLRLIATLLSSRLEEGHICIYKDDAILPSDDTSWQDWQKSPWTGNPQDLTKPIIIDSDRIYLQKYWTYETTIITKIKNLLSSQLKLPDDKIIDLHFTHPNLYPVDNTRPFPEGIDWQGVAALHAIKYRFTIITGGPGTGKTTTVARILSLKFDQSPNLKVALTAPTGKAAARMNDSLLAASDRFHPLVANDAKMPPIEASTVHRLLKYHPESRKFRHDKDHPLPYDLVIVDESSMMDISLFSALMTAIPDDGQLILLGDSHQLTSVGAGTIFGDLCHSSPMVNAFDEHDLQWYNAYLKKRKSLTLKKKSTGNSLLDGHIIQLMRSHRFDPQKGIGLFSKSVLADQVSPRDIYHPFSNGQDPQMHIIDHLDDPVFAKHLKDYETIAKEDDITTALKNLSLIRTLCATHEGDRGTKAVNEKIKNHLRSKGLAGHENFIFHNQPIMITKNDYNLGLFNGDEGLIRKDHVTGQYLAYFLDGSTYRTFPPAIIGDFVTAYAITIHKSQGSEYKTVIIILPGDPEHRLLTKNLLYTGVTRAKEKVILVGSQESILHAASRKTQRISGIVPRLVK